MSHQMQSVPASGDVPVSGNDLALFSATARRSIGRSDPPLGRGTLRVGIDVRGESRL